jgi:hypothetical protein
LHPFIITSCIWPQEARQSNIAAAERMMACAKRMETLSKEP